MTVRAQAFTDYKRQMRTANTLYRYYRDQIAEVIRQTTGDTLNLVSGHLALLPPDQMNFMTARRYNILDRLKDDLHRLYDHAGYLIEKQWEDQRLMLGLHARLVAGYIARKNQPPWMPVVLDFEAVRNQRKDLWRNLIHFHMRNLADFVVRQVNQALVNEESLHDILQRVRSVLKVKPKKRRAREIDYRDPSLKSIQDMGENVADTWSDTQTIFGKPPVEVTEGTFTLEDVEQLQADQVKAMGWEQRAYTPDDDALWEKNKMLNALEQSLTTDVLDLMHDGVIQIGTDNMGIKDFVWVLSRPQPECDSCTDRDGLTMTDIKKKFGSGVFSKGEAWPPGLKKDSPPPLHPHCRCQIVPQLNDEWSKNALKKSGYEWDEDDGTAFNPNVSQRKLGFKDLSWDEWMAKVGGL